MTDLLYENKLGDGSWCNAPQCDVRLFAFVDVELGWAWRAYDLQNHKWLTNAERAQNEDDARRLAEEWVRAVVHDRRWGVDFAWHRATDEMTLVCDRCGKTKRIRLDVWYQWKKDYPTSVQLCSKPKDGVNYRSGECGGALTEPLPRWNV